MRKYKIFKVYQRDEIIKSLEFQLENINILSEYQVSNIAMNLYKMKIPEIRYFQPLIYYIQKNALDLEVSTLSNVLFVLSKVPKNPLFNIH